MKTRTCDPSGMGWEQCTPEGSERAQLLVWSRLSLREKLMAVEEMGALSARLLARRQREGLPYIDPDTGVLVPGRSVEGKHSLVRVAEEPQDSQR